MLQEKYLIFRDLVLAHSCFFYELHVPVNWLSIHQNHNVSHFKVAPLYACCCLLDVIESGLQSKLFQKMYSMRCGLQCICWNNILKIHLWLSTCLACQHTTGKFKLYRRCFMVNFMIIFRTNVVKNLSGWVLLNKKLLAMCELGFKNFCPQIRCFLLSDMCVRIHNYQNLCTDHYVPTLWLEMASE